MNAIKSETTADNTSNNKLFKTSNIRTYAMVIALVVIMVLFQIITKGIFFTPRNISNLARGMSITGVITMGMMLIIVSGNMDLAVGSIVAITGGVAAIMQVWYGASTPVAILTALGLAVLIGLWQGFWIAYRKVPSFIVTLGNMLILRGIYMVWTQGITITPLQKDFVFISQGYLPGVSNYIFGGLAIVAIIISTLRKRQNRRKHNLTLEPLTLMIVKMVVVIAVVGVFVYLMLSHQGIPVPVIILIVLALLFEFISQKTSFGRRVYAIGGNPEAAKLSGINVNRHMLVLYIITALLSAVSGIMLTARLDGAVAAAGQSYEMDIISACVIGGASLAGGRGTVLGSIIGALLIASLDNGMSLLNLTYYYQSIVKGLVLILAVWFDVSSQLKNK